MYRYEYTPHQKRHKCPRIIWKDIQHHIIIWELQIKREIRYHCIPNKMAKTQTLTTPNAGKDVD